MIAYNKTWFDNLQLVKEAKSWLKEKFISPEQYSAIKETYPTHFYHPNVIIRILLFIASLIALGGVTGLLGLMFGGLLDNFFEELAFFYGIASWVFMEMIFIKNNKHFKSGVNEALLYHSLGWTIGGFAGMINNLNIILIFALVLLAFAAIRYVDLICTALAIGVFSYLVFYNLYEAGEITRQIIPFVFIAIFIPVYFVASRSRRKFSLVSWNDNLIILEAAALLIIYAAGNYLVVRELSIEMMGIFLEEGQDIPFAWLFYLLTIAIPIIFLVAGLRKKDIILLRVSVVAIVFSAFTFKYYFSLGHPEVTLTLAGAILLTIAMSLFRYLRTPRNGFTRENIIKEKWADANPQAFIISQTMGGNKLETTGEINEMGGGGISSGGGSSDRF